MAAPMTPVASFTIRDYPDLKLALALDVDDDPVALAVQVEGHWVVRRHRHGRAVDFFFDKEEQAMQALAGLAAMS